MGMGVQPRTPAAFYPGKGPSSHCTGGWVGPVAGMDRCGQSCPHWGFHPQTMYPELLYSVCNLVPHCCGWSFVNMQNFSCVLMVPLATRCWLI